MASCGAVLVRLVLAAVAGSLAGCVLAGCGHRQQVSYVPAPAIRGQSAGEQGDSGASAETASQPRTRPARPEELASGPQEAESQSDAEFVAAHRPIYSETGLASWYGPPYHNRRGANGQIFNQNAMTAAHRTLPMNSLIRATNLSTGQSAIVRVTDRGPFVGDRFLDLSVASAKAIGVWLPGTAEVRIDVYEAPKPIALGGRWCVQVGAFDSGHKSVALMHHLEKKYTTAKVTEFTGPTGHWVLIRPAMDDKGKAVEIAAKLKPDQGRAYLVRLD